MRGHTPDGLTLELDLPFDEFSVLASEEPGDAHEGCGLASAVGAKQGRDLPSGHVDRDTADRRCELVVNDLYLFEVQHD